MHNEPGINLNVFIVQVCTTVVNTMYCFWLCILCSGVVNQTPVSITSVEDTFRDEVRSYEKEQSPPITDDFDPLQWWSQRTEKFPLLSDIARRIYVIPASSAECERHFSAFNARHIITAQRNSMSPETVEALSVVLEGYKNKIIT